MVVKMVEPCCCVRYVNEDFGWTVDSLQTDEGPVDRINSRFDWRDRLSWWRVRWGIGRMDMAVRPGLYALNAPTRESEVLVTSNYKMSFDHVRRSLEGRAVWILVLDTKGINVWCAAGKGTFGTEELVNRVLEVGLARIVSHGRLILPQLGAVGVNGGAVAAQTGFRVRFGPIRATDIPAYLDAGREATPEMRRVTFSILERAVLIPVEILNAGKYLVPTMVGLFALSGLFRSSFSLERMLSQGPVSVLALAAAWFGGTVLGPLLLPVLPGRMFSSKGAIAAAFVMLCMELVGWFAGAGLLDHAAFWLAVPAISSFIMMNFTGATPITSPSGVRREMKFSVPVQAAASGIAVALWVAQRFVGV